MIEFTGPLTGQCKKFLIRKQLKLQATAAILTIAIFSVLLVVFSKFLVKEVYLFCLLAFPLYIIFNLIPPGKQSQKIFMPKRLFIDLEEGVIVHECEKTERFHMLNSVKKVIDYGDWYEIVFQYSDRDPYFVCQKNLITQGTLEEFEELFKNIIVRHAERISK